jgi:hypothetical protein
METCTVPYCYDGIEVPPLPPGVQKPRKEVHMYKLVQYEIDAPE